jgi:hypothetical protein
MRGFQAKPKPDTAFRCRLDLIRLATGGCASSGTVLFRPNVQMTRDADLWTEHSSLYSPNRLKNDGRHLPDYRSDFAVIAEK